MLFRSQSVAVAANDAFLHDADGAGSVALADVRTGRQHRRGVHGRQARIALDGASGASTLMTKAEYDSVNLGRWQLADGRHVLTPSVNVDIIANALIDVKRKCAFES